jgi:hypothetical protein
MNLSASPIVNLPIPPQDSFGCPPDLHVYPSDLPDFSLVSFVNLSFHLFVHPHSGPYIFVPNLSLFRPDLHLSSTNLSVPPISPSPISHRSLYILKLVSSQDLP